MLLGTYQAKFAAGHRVAVPSQLRKDLGEIYILAKWYEGCLVLVAKSSWSALLMRMTGGQKMVVMPIRDTERFIFASAYEVFPDEQGRIIIPDRLTNYAQLGEEVFFIGLGDRIEIWNRESWEQKERTLAKDSADYIEKLAKDERGK